MWPRRRQPESKTREPRQLRASRSSSRSRSGNNASVRHLFRREAPLCRVFCDGRIGHRPDWVEVPVGEKINSAASCEFGVGSVAQCDHATSSKAAQLRQPFPFCSQCKQPGGLRLQGQAWNHSHVGSSGYPQVRNIDGGCSTSRCHASRWKQGLMCVKDIGQRGCDNFQQSLNAAADYICQVDVPGAYCQF